MKPHKTQVLTNLLGLLILNLFIATQAHSAQTPEAGDTYTFQVLFTSDLHGFFTHWDYINDRANQGGLDRIAAVIKEKTAPGSFFTSPDQPSTREDTILFDLGDKIWGNLSLNWRELGQTMHPVVKGLSFLGFEAAVIGNHEFDVDIDAIFTMHEGFAGKILSANYLNKQGQELFSPYYIKTMKNGLKVAVIGITTDMINYPPIMRLKEHGSTRIPAISAARNAIQRIKNNELADILILAGHMSQKQLFDWETSEVNDLLADPYIAQNIAFFAGAHMHTATEKQINSVKYMENDAFGRSVAQAFISATYDGSRWSVANPRSDILTNVINIDGSVPPDEEYSKALEKEDLAFKEYAREIIGSYAGAGMIPKMEIRGTTPQYLQDSILADFISSAMLHVTEADFVYGPSGFGSAFSFQAGPIRRRDIAKLYPYYFELCTLKMTGHQLKKVMEYSYAFFGKEGKGNSRSAAVNLDQDLIIPYGNNPKVLSWVYSPFSGLRYDVDLTRPSGDRICNLQHMNGETLNLDKKYVVATDNVQVHFLQLHTMAYENPHIEIIDMDINTNSKMRGIRGAIEQYILDLPGKEVSDMCDNNWKFINLHWDEELRRTAIQLINEQKISVKSNTPGAVRAITKDEIRKAAKQLAIQHP